MDLTADVHYEEGAYWAHVRELPGCFASGHTLDELMEVLEEAIELYLASDADTAEASAPTRHASRLSLSFDKLPVSA
jgi:predicted RNase H-like HicB family nuclease